MLVTCVPLRARWGDQAIFDADLVGPALRSRGFARALRVVPVTFPSARAGRLPGRTDRGVNSVRSCPVPELLGRSHHAAHLSKLGALDVCRGRRWYSEVSPAGLLDPVSIPSPGPSGRGDSSFAHPRNHVLGMPLTDSNLTAIPANLEDIGHLLLRVAEVAARFPCALSERPLGDSSGERDQGGRHDARVAKPVNSNSYLTPILIPIGEVARLTGVTIPTVRNWDRAGKLTATRTPGGQRRFRLADVQALIDDAEEQTSEAGCGDLPRGEDPDRDGEADRCSVCRNDARGGGVMTARVDQETTIAIGRDDTVVRIWSNVLPHVRRLRKSEFAVEINGGDDWGQFEVPVEFFHLFSAFRRKRAVRVMGVIRVAVVVLFILACGAAGALWGMEPSEARTNSYLLLALVFIGLGVAGAWAFDFFAPGPSFADSEEFRRREGKVDEGVDR
ncbi:hypothetical protein QYM36_019437 [Artemia franciscana]|uniref:HTH merR-type domain-containing protein n=1 Tax=Artemia franciscana TaxID=6661 RepID=A0AA88KTD5_ARTSF|nr:hypothetical protein QYM36_019437 [Artemia franciscana]